VLHLFKPFRVVYNLECKVFKVSKAPCKTYRAAFNLDFKINQEEVVLQHSEVEAHLQLYVVAEDTLQEGEVEAYMDETVVRSEFC